MQAHSVVRQKLALAVLIYACIGVAGAGVVWATLVLPPGTMGTAMLPLGVALAALGVVAVVLMLLSITQRADLDATGIRSREFGARWSFGWQQVERVWIVFHRGLPYLAVLPVPDAAEPRHRTSWRARRLNLPERARTVGLDGSALDAVASVVRTYRGYPPEVWQA